MIQKGMLKIYLNVLRNENTVWRLCRAGSILQDLTFLAALTETKNQNWPNNTDISIRKKDRTYLMLGTYKSRHTIQLDTLHKWVHVRLLGWRVGAGMEEAELSPGVVKFPQPIF